MIEETLRDVLTYKKFSVLYIDIDSFKFFNDTFGFSEGDELFKETANIITGIIDTTDNQPSFVGHISKEAARVKSKCKTAKKSIFLTQEDLKAL